MQRDFILRGKFVRYRVQSVTTHKWFSQAGVVCFAIVRFGIVALCGTLQSTFLSDVDDDISITATFHDHVTCQVKYWDLDRALLVRNLDLHSHTL